MELATASAGVPVLPGALDGGRYRLEGVLGRGAFGVTYRAFDTRLARPVAVKELLGTGTPADTERERRFLAEARALARFTHPGIVRVYELLTEEEHGRACVVMELLEGRSLREVLERRGRLPCDEALRLVRQAGAALGVVHAGGLLHRDVKPDNVLLADAPEGADRVVLVDFGAARQFGAEGPATMTRLLTPGYAPPEQYSGRTDLGPATDTYALGATCYELLTGFPPPAATDRAAGAELVSPAALVPEVPSRVGEAVCWALALRPADRPPSVLAFLAALDAPEPLGAPRPRPEAERTVVLSARPRTGSAPAPTERAGAPRAARPALEGRPPGAGDPDGGGGAPDGRPGAVEPGSSPGPGRSGTTAGAGPQTSAPQAATSPPAEEAWPGDGPGPGATRPFGGLAHRHARPASRDRADGGATDGDAPGPGWAGAPASSGHATPPAGTQGHGPGAPVPFATGPAAGGFAPVAGAPPATHRFGAPPAGAAPPGALPPLPADTAPHHPGPAPPPPARGAPAVLADPSRPASSSPPPPAGTATRHLGPAPDATAPHHPGPAPTPLRAVPGTSGAPHHLRPVPPASSPPRPPPGAVRSYSAPTSPFARPVPGAASASGTSPLPVDGRPEPPRGAVPPAPATAATPDNPLAWLRLAVGVLALGSAVPVVVVATTVLVAFPALNAAAAARSRLFERRRDRGRRWHDGVSAPAGFAARLVRSVVVSAWTAAWPGVAVAAALGVAKLAPGALGASAEVRLAAGAGSALLVGWHLRRLERSATFGRNVVRVLGRRRSGRVEALAWALAAAVVLGAAATSLTWWPLPWSWRP